MIIEALTVGAGKKRRTVYDVCTTPAENGTDRPQRVARLDTLADAATVLRYLSFAETEDAQQARELLIKADAQNEKGTR